MAKCVDCGTELSQDARYCSNCGTQVGLGRDVYDVSAGSLIGKVKEIIQDARVKRIVIKDEKANLLLSIPITWGTAGDYLFPADQMSKASADLSRQVASVARAMTEQSTAAVQVTSALESMKVQGEQAARATAEQARTMREMAKATDATARELKLITKANLSQSAAAERLVEQLASGPGSGSARASSAKRVRASLVRPAARTVTAQPKSGNGRHR